MELRAFIDFMRKRSRSGGPKTISLDGKFYASFPSINQISEGLFQTLVHSTVSQEIKAASGWARAFWARGQSAGGVVTGIFHHKKYQIHGKHRYLPADVLQGHAGWQPPPEQLQDFAGVPVSYKLFPGTWEVSCIPLQNSCSVHITSRHMQNNFRNPHSLSTK